MKEELLFIGKQSIIIDQFKRELRELGDLKQESDLKAVQEYLKRASKVLAVIMETDCINSERLEFIRELRNSKQHSDILLVALVTDMAKANTLNLMSVGFDDWFSLAEEPKQLRENLKQLIHNKRIYKNICLNSNYKKSILDNSFLAVVIIDAINFDILYMNNTSKDMLEMGNNDFVGKKCFSFITGGLQHCADCHLFSAFKAKKDRMLYIPKLDKTFRVRVDSTEWFGRPAYVEYLEDVTEESKEKQLAIERYQRELKRKRRVDLDFMAYLVVDVTKGVVVDHDPHGFPVPVLKPGQKMQDFADRVLPTLIDYEERKQFTHMMDPAYLQKVFDMGQDFLKIDCRRYARNQKYIMWTRSVIQLLKNPENDNLMMFLYTYDINEQKMLEEIIDHVVKYDYKTIAYINTYAETIKLLASNGVYEHDNIKPYSDYNTFLEESFMNYVVGEEREELKKKLSIENLQKELSTKDRYELLVSLLVKGVPKAYKLRFSNYKDSSYGIIQGMFIDIEDTVSGLKTEKQLLESATISLGKGNSAKNRYLASISHSLTKPLKQLGQFLKQLDTSYDKETVGVELAHAKENLVHIMEVLNDINDICNLENGDINIHEMQFSLSELVKDLVKKINKINPKSKGVLSVKKEIYNEACYGDYKIIQKILFNILDNAFRYAADSGRIELYVNEMPAEEPSKGYYRFLIKDYGKGIHKELLENIFKPFYCTINNKSRSDSSGLGLAITKALVDKLGGNISIESEPNYGTIVTVDLIFPLASSLLERQSMVDELHRDIGDIKVLFVEKDKLATLVARRLLIQKGVKLSSCSNNKQVKQLLKHENFNCIVLEIDDDLSLINEFFNIRNSQAKGKNIPIIVICKNMSVEDSVALINKGVEGVFFKPLKFAEFNKRLMEVCHVEEI